MLTNVLRALLRRDLNQLKQEIEAYQREDAIWLTAPGITNSAGNLCLHLVANLNAHFGAVLGRTTYVRQRELEFSLKNVPRQDLLASIDATLVVVETTLAALADDQLTQDYPRLLEGRKVTIAYFITHLATHFSYHLGQINYHRRLLDH